MDFAYGESQAGGGYTKKIVRRTAASGALDFLAAAFDSTTTIPAVAFKRAVSYQPAALPSLGSIPAVTLRRGVILSAGGFSTISEIPAIAVSRACTLRPAVLSSTSQIPAFAIARPAIIPVAALRIVSTIPVCSGIGIRPAPPRPPIQPGQIKGASVRFTDFTMGWAELHRFMDVNEWTNDAPAITMDNSGTNISGWTGAASAGMCIPGVRPQTSPPLGKRQRAVPGAITRSDRRPFLAGSISAERRSGRSRARMVISCGSSRT